MRRFDADYLTATREGMWESREALSGLALAAHERVLDVGCGTGELTAVLREECPGEVVGVDADAAHRAHVPDPRVQGDATRLPFADDSFDLVVCQALLINLPDPAAAVREFARVASDRVAAIEPDNSAVRVESTVDNEATLAARARERYLDGIETDVTLGAGAADLLREAGLSAVSVDRYDHERTVAPPYSEGAVEAARRKVTGAAIDDDRATMAGSQAEIDDLRADWRAMGRDAVAQMDAGEYRRREVVPFYVSVGCV